MPIGDDSLRIAGELRAAVTAAADGETRALVRAWARAWDEIVAEVDAAALEIAGLEQAPAIGQVRRLERARRAMEEAHAAIVRMLDRSAGRIATVALDVATAAAQSDALLIASQLPRAEGSIADLAARFERVDVAALEVIAERTARQVTSLAWPLADDAVEAMLRSLVAGVALGQSPREVARQMVRRTETAFNGGLTRAMTIARTEILDAYRTAAAMSQQANRDVLDGWIWYAQLDTRTCPSCVAQHGSLHSLDEPGPDDHHNGRCTRMPKTKTWAELGFTQRERGDRVEAGSVWFARQPRQVQQQILGPGRWQLWSEDRISFDDLTTRRATPGWRPSYVPTPLRDLVA